MDAGFPLETPPGFRGLDPHESVMIYTRHLPHWRQRGASYFVTFRLGDSLPQEKLDELKRIKRRALLDRQQSGEADHKSGALEYLARITYEKSERWLDQGMGRCVLRSPEAREIVAESLHFFDGTHYELSSYVIMPNHVHLIVRPLIGFELETILQGRKRSSARGLNQLIGSEGALWQEESFDRIIRDARHLWKCIQYIGRNPAMASLESNAFTRWIGPDWKQCGWDFER